MPNQLKMKKAQLNKLLIVLLIACIHVTYAQYTSYDWNERDDWMRIDTFLEVTPIEKGALVADIGCHEGYLSMHLARQVGPSGKVYAVDVNDYRLDALNDNAKERSLKNITTVLGDYDDPKLPEGAIDIIYVIDSYHEMSSHRKMRNHFFKALKPKGKIVFLEKLKQRKIGASRDSQTAAHTLAMKYVKRELKQTGFLIEKEIDNYGYWEGDSTKQMWILVASKP